MYLHIMRRGRMRYIRASARMVVKSYNTIIKYIGIPRGHRFNLFSALYTATYRTLVSKTDVAC